MECRLRLEIVNISKFYIDQWRHIVHRFTHLYVCDRGVDFITRHTYNESPPSNVKIDSKRTLVFENHWHFFFHNHVFLERDSPVCCGKCQICGSVSLAVDRQNVISMRTFPPISRLKAHENLDRGVLFCFMYISKGTLVTQEIKGRMPGPPL